MESCIGMKAISLSRPGSAEVLEFVDRREPVPAAGEVLVQIAAAGVNFMDIGIRRGAIWTEMPYPKSMGVEGAGRVIGVGEGVTEFKPGQRVAWVYAPGSYAERIVVPSTSLVSVPDTIDDHTAAAVMMQGLTASHFATDFYPIQPGDVALVHAAAGGLGLLLSQIIRLRGGRVIGRVSSEAKVDIARAAGAADVIVDAEGDFGDQVLSLTKGNGVDVVYDGSGPVTFAGSLASLRRCGTFCWFGPVLGRETVISLMSLPKSIKIGFGVFLDHIYTVELLRERTARLFRWIEAGDIKPNVGAIYPLRDVVQAHIALETRVSTGKLLLIP
jgi:NADPH2:quinone reductase